MAELCFGNRRNKIKAGLVFIAISVLLTFSILNTGISITHDNYIFNKKQTQNVYGSLNKEIMITSKIGYYNVTKSVSNNCESIKQPKGDFCNNIVQPVDNEIETRNDFWQTDRIFIGSNIMKERIFAINGYYDDRPALDGNITIRIFFAVTEKKLKLTKASMFPSCHLWYECIKYPKSVPAVLSNTDKRILEVNGTVYRNYVMSCEVPRNIAELKSSNITHVSLSFDSTIKDRCSQSVLYLPIVYPQKSSTTHLVGMCEANGVSFGKFNNKFAPWLIEWFEANIMFGISEFNVYNATLRVADNVQKVLNYYQDRGYLKLHQHPTPLEQYNPFNRDSADIGMRTALNDCIYRNMYRYRYIAGIDLDEIIVPHKHENYNQMLRLSSVKKYEYSFVVTSGAYFQSFLGDDDTKVESKYPLITSQYLKRVYDERIKSFFNPRTCYVAFSHRCLKKLSTSPNKYLSTSVASVHHYRSACLKDSVSKFSHEACRKRSMKTHISNRMLHFQDQLYERVSKVASLLKIEI